MDVVRSDKCQQAASARIKINLIARDDNHIRRNIGNPSFDHLTVNQPVVHSGENDGHNQSPVRYSVATLICSRP